MCGNPVLIQGMYISVRMVKNNQDQDCTFKNIYKKIKQLFKELLVLECFVKSTDLSSKKKHIFSHIPS